MAQPKLDKGALKRFQDKRPVHEKRVNDLLGFSDPEAVPLYCYPVLNSIEIPLTIAAFAGDGDFAPPVSFLISTDEYDCVVPAGGHAKLLSSYLMDSGSFDHLRTLWHGLIHERHQTYVRQTAADNSADNIRCSIRDGAEFFIRCLAFHELEYENDFQILRPILANSGIEESELDIEP
jgi:hypothetical protein